MKICFKIIQQVKIFIAVFSIMFIISSCEWENKRFYIESLQLYIDADLLDSVETKTPCAPLRISIYDNKNRKGQNYIDISHDMSEMPSIILCVPHKTLDTIYILDDWNEVRHIQSQNFKFIHLAPERVMNGEHISEEKYQRIHQVIDKMDSVRLKIPSTSIQLNSGIVDLSIWENDKYKGKITNHNKK